MQTINQTPGQTLKMFLKKTGLNCNRLAKAINMSNAMVRLVALDKSPISLSVAVRLAKFFKNKPEYWLTIQMYYDVKMVGKNKVLSKEISNITDYTKYKFVRKPHVRKNKPALTVKSKTAIKGKVAVKKRK